MIFARCLGALPELLISHYLMRHIFSFNQYRIVSYGDFVPLCIEFQEKDDKKRSSIIIHDKERYKGLGFGLNCRMPILPKRRYRGT